MIYIFFLLSQDIAKIPQESLPAATTPLSPKVGGAELSKLHILITKPSNFLGLWQHDIYRQHVVHDF